MAGFLRPPDLLARQRVVFVRTDRLGETLLNLPAIHALRQAYPQAHLTIMLHPSLRDLFVAHPDMDDVVQEPVVAGPWWWRAWRLSRLWRSWHADLIILSNPKKEYHLGAWLAGIPRRVGWDRKWGWLLTDRLADRKALGEHHELEYNLMLLQPLGIELEHPPILRLPIDAGSAATDILQRLSKLGVAQTDRLVAVHPWTSNPAKQWPLERFQQLSDELSQRPGVRVVVVGGLEEQTAMPQFMKRRQMRVVDVVGTLSLRELAALLQHVRVLVSNDSGPMHVAAAVGTPVVALFGTAEVGSHPRRWGPWGAGHTVIHKTLEAIEVEEVVAAVGRYV